MRFQTFQVQNHENPGQPPFDWKLIWTPESSDTEWQLFDLASDPDAARNLWHPDHPHGRELRAEFEAWLQGMDQQPVAPDAEELELLRSLGYVE